MWLSLLSPKLNEKAKIGESSNYWWVLAVLDLQPQGFGFLGCFLQFMGQIYMCVCVYIYTHRLLPVGILSLSVACQEMVVKEDDWQQRNNREFSISRFWGSCPHTYVLVKNHRIILLNFTLCNYIFYINLSQLSKCDLEK